MQGISGNLHCRQFVTAKIFCCALCSACASTSIPCSHLPRAGPGSPSLCLRWSWQVMGKVRRTWIGITGELLQGLFTYSNQLLRLMQDLVCNNQLVCVGLIFDTNMHFNRHPWKRALPLQLCGCLYLIQNEYHHLGCPLVKGHRRAH